MPNRGVSFYGTLSKKAPISAAASIPYFCARTSNNASLYAFSYNFGSENQIKFRLLCFLCVLREKNAVGRRLCPGTLGQTRG